MSTAVIVNSNQMGSGDATLGIKILGSCLRKLVSMDDVDVVVFYNGGVQLLARESPVAVEIDLLKEQGVELLACQTCVDFFDLRGQLVVDRVSNMDEILKTLQSADKVITL